MSRYLTPSKIGLLALIALYTEFVVPSAATIPILSFLVSRVLPINSSASGNEAALRPRDSTLAIDEFQKATIGYVSGIPGRTIWDLLLNKLWKLNSFDALHVFFDSLSSLLQQTPEEQQKEAEDGVDQVLNANHMLISRTSPLGVFVRRAQLEFTRLQFHDGVTLWKGFVAYRTPSLAQWKRRNQTAGDTSFDVNLQEDHLGLGDRLTEVIYGELGAEGQQGSNVSTEDVEKLLEYQVDHMQSMWEL